jgi:hypothetical protein
MRRLGTIAVLLFAGAAHAHEWPTASGTTGLLHTPSARSGDAGMVRGALLVDWFSASRFLCSDEHPCGTATTDEQTHTGATAAIGVTPVRDVDLFLAGRAYTNRNSTSDQLHEVFGDTNLGAKWAHAFGALHLGGSGEALFGSGVGNVGLRSTGFRLRALSTYDASRVRVHLAASYLFDNTSALVRDVEPLSRVERFGLGINRVDRFEASVGAELVGRIAPFMEYALGVPVNRQHYTCPAARSGEACVRAYPSVLTLGVRAAAISGEHLGVSILGALDIAVTNRFATSMAPTAPYTLWLGVAFSLPIHEPAPRVVVEREEVPVAPPIVSVRGFVHPIGSKDPIADAKVTFVGAKRPPLLTGTDGVFGADLPPGTYEFSIHADGYKDGTCSGTAVGLRDRVNTLNLDCPLVRTE